MLVTPLLLLAIYASALFIVSVLGGWITEIGTMTHTRTQIVMSFVAGFLMGISLFHLLPSAVESLPDEHAIETVVLWIAAGMLSMVILLRAFDFHQHDFSGESANLFSEGDVKTSLLGIAVGLGFHTITEGAALGTSMRIQMLQGDALPGIAACLAILLHKPLDAYSITGMMKVRGYSLRSRTIVNIGYASICPAIVILIYLLAELSEPILEGPVFGCALAYAVGAFLCIALSDLLPEIHFHRHDRGKLLASLAGGITLAYVLHAME